MQISKTFFKYLETFLAKIDFIICSTEANSTSMKTLTKTGSTFIKEQKQKDFQLLPDPS